jgi:hypothetical protein
MNWPRFSRPMIAVTVTRPIVVTVAIRTPAMMTGSASGRSTRTSTWVGEYPIPTAASRTSGGTPRSPAKMFRIRISRV